MSTDGTIAAELNAAWSGVVTPFSQVRTNANPDNGVYDLFITKIEPRTEPKKGRYVIQVGLKILAPAEVASSPLNTFNPTFFIGTEEDLFATQPETRKKSMGYSGLKKIAAACGVPANDQTDAALCAALLNKSFTCRIETKGEYCNLGRNPVKLGAIPAKLDAVQASALNGSAAVATPVTSDVPAGAFATE
jgi:hypothetical protein